MKKKQIIISFISAILLLGSCREIKVNTKVNKDGSFTRMITITGDSSEVFKSDLPYPVDETWKREFIRDTAEHENYVLIYKKSFKNSNLLNEEINQDTSWRRNLQRNITVKKKFGFFYSYLVYRETIKAANPFTSLDYKDYISKEDLLWLSGKKTALNSSDSAKIEDAEKRVEAYLRDVLTIEILDALKQGTERTNPAGQEYQANEFEMLKDSIAKKVADWDFQTTLDFINYINKWTPDTYMLKELKLHLFKNLDKKVQLLVNIYEMEDYKVSVELPGIITRTNSLSTKGNQVSWNVTGPSFLFEDYIMIVESRIVNYWMFVLTGIILLSLIGLIIWKSRK
jgi:hypothetical protein